MIIIKLKGQEAAMLVGKRQIRFSMKHSQKYFEKFEVMLNI